MFYIIALLSNGKRHLVMMSCRYHKKFQNINRSPNSSKFLAIKKQGYIFRFPGLFHGRHCFPVKTLWLSLGSFAGFPKGKSRLVQYSTAQCFFAFFKSKAFLTLHNPQKLSSYGRKLPEAVGS